MSQSNRSEGSRRYSSRLRDDQARETRRRILHAAYGLFTERGYTATTMSAVAAAAGVSAQTVYNTFGSKPALLKAVYDVRLAGDDDPVAMADRPLMARLRTETDPYALLQLYARVGRQLLDRIGGFVLVLNGGAQAGDADLAAHIATIDDERLTGATHLVRRLVELDGLRPGVTPEAARDMIWTLNSVEVWHLLTGLRGWSGEDYEEWIGQAMCSAVLR